MDTRLIFRDRRICDGVTDCSMHCPQLDVGPFREKALLANPERTTSSDAATFSFGGRESAKRGLEHTLYAFNYACDRTANRHRWSARVEQDERVRGPQGTRQKSSRKFAIRLAPHTTLSSTKEKWSNKMSMHAVRIGTSSAVRMDDVGAAMVVESASLPMVSIWQFTWVDMTTKSN